MAATILFRADASITLGAGHVMRCLALADGLHTHGHRCAFAVDAGTLQTVPALSHSSHDIIKLHALRECESILLGERYHDGLAWLVVDHYQRDAAFEANCRPWAKNILVIDDLADRKHDCNALLDPALGRTAGDYAGKVPEDCRRLLGPDYALIRKQFAEARQSALERDRAACTRLFVSFGATDPHGHTLTALEGIRRSGLNATVDIMIGASSPHVETVSRTAVTLPFTVNIHEQPDNVATLMAAADLAIGASGSTSWERCCVGLPAIVVVTADNQKHIAAALEDTGAAVVLGQGERFDADELAAVLDELCAHGSHLQTMSTAAAAICDGRGVDRVCDIMLQ